MPFTIRADSALHALAADASMPYVSPDHTSTKSPNLDYASLASMVFGSRSRGAHPGKTRAHLRKKTFGTFDISMVFVDAAPANLACADGSMPGTNDIT